MTLRPFTRRDMMTALSIAAQAEADGQRASIIDLLVLPQVKVYALDHGGYSEAYGSIELGWPCQCSGRCGAAADLDAPWGSPQLCEDCAIAGCQTAGDWACAWLDGK